MKKLLVVLLALTVVGVFAFAEDAAPAPALVISGSGQTGIQLTGGNGADLAGQLYSSNNGTPGDLWVDLTYAGTNAGGKIELYSKTDVSGPILDDVLYGWWKPVSMLTVNVGYGYGQAVTTPIEGWSNGGTGVELRLAPVAGLDLAVEFDATNAVTKIDLSKQIGFFGAYTADGIGTFSADYDLGTKLLIAGINVSAVPNLTAQADAKYNTGDSTYRFEENVAYAIDALKPAVWAYESSISGDAAWGVKPSVAYTIGSVTPSAYFQYNADSSWKLGAAAAFTVEKNAINVYADYKSSTAYDVGLRYVVSF